MPGGWNGESTAATLFRHLEAAGEATLATQYLLSAIQQAEQVFAYDEALQLCQRGLALLEPLPSTERPAAYQRLLERLGWIQYERRDFNAADQAFVALLREAERLADADQQLEALHGLCFCTLQSQRFTEVEPHLQRALQLAEDTGNERRRSEMLALRGVVLANLDAYQPAVQVLEQSLAIAWPLRHMRALELGIDCLGFVHHRRGDYLQCVAESRRALQLELHPRVAIACRLRLGIALAWLGCVSEGFAELALAEQQARRKSQVHTLLSLPLRHGSILLELGIAARALDLQQAVLPELQRRPLSNEPADPVLVQNLARCHFQVSKACLQLGRATAARDALDRGEQVFSASGYRAHHQSLDQTELTLARIELQLALGDAHPLLPAAEAALDAARRTDTIDDEVRIALLLARIHQQHGDLESAAQALSRSLDLVQRYPLPLFEWQLHALLSDLKHAAGELAASIADARLAAQTIATIASHIDDIELRRDFLDAPKTRTVLGRAS